MSPSQTLNDLKHVIAKSQVLGKVPPNQQRVFYLGRELNSPNRSLSKLLGRFNVNVIHFMATTTISAKPPPTNKEVVVDDDSSVIVENDKPTVTIDLSSDGDNESDDDVVEVIPVAKRRRRI